MRRYACGFFCPSSGDFLGFLALVAVVGWAVIEGVIWIARFLFRHLAWIP